MVRVGSAKPLRMFPNPELGRRVNTVRAISHAPMNLCRQDTMGLEEFEVQQLQNCLDQADRMEQPGQLEFS